MAIFISYTIYNMIEYQLNKKNIQGVKMLMVEQDAGYISPDEPRNEAFITEVKNLGLDKIVIAEPLVVYVVLQKYGVLNKNGRIYPKAVLEKVNNEYQDAIRERRALGELDHPEATVISGDRVSHNILQTWWEGNTLMGKMEILMSPGFIKQGIVSTKGDAVANLLRNRIRVGVSSRGLGSLQKDKDGYLIVQEDFEVICWDVVTTPSTPGAWIIDKPGQTKNIAENIVKESNELNDILDNFLLD